jgi:hypothetical protein
MKFTVEQFASANGVQKPVAYGFLRFLAEKGLASTSKADKKEGTRGKPSVVYDLPETVTQAFGIVEYVAPAQPEVAAPAETTSTEQPAA